MDYIPPTDWTKHPLHVAAMSGNADEVARLLSEGADVNKEVRLEGTPLHTAIGRGPGDAAVVRLLLEKGASVDARLTVLGTPLHHAAKHGDRVAADILLTHGADVNSKEEYQHCTPLHRAVAGGHADMVEFLISKGADVNAVADYVFSRAAARAFPDAGMTPLHIAAREGKLGIVRLLVAAGATNGIKVAPHSRHHAGKTAYDLALEFQTELQNHLRDAVSLVELLGPQPAS